MKKLSAITPELQAWLIEFSTRLKNAMDELEIDQGRLAEVTGISVASIYFYLRGNAIPSAYHAKKLADALFISVADLIDF